MIHSTIETKSATPLETKTGESFEAKFGAYHAEVLGKLDAASAALEDEKKHVDELEQRLNDLMLTGAAGRKTGQVDATKERAAFGTYVKSGDYSGVKALSADNATEGGFVVRTQFAATINQRIFDASPIRQLARVIPLDRGDGWSEPLDFSDVGASWVGEKDSRTETTNPTLAELTIPLHEVYAHQTVTQKLLDLADVDIGAWIEGKIADKFARTEGTSYVSGDGVGKPRGFLDYSTSTADDTTRTGMTLQYKVSGTATTIADSDGQGNGLIDLFWSLASAYRSNAAWLMSSNTANNVDKLKDKNGQYLWRNGMTSGAPPELLGRPVYFDENMPAPAANSFPVAFGDLSKAYTIVDWNGIRTIRDPFTSKPNVIFYAYRRTGGGLSNPYALKLLKCST